MKRKSAWLLTLIVFAILAPFGNHALGLTVNYQYDNLYRLTRVERSDGIVTEYRYDGAGNRLSRAIRAIVTGDLNGDGVVTVADAVMTMQVISGITPGQEINQSARVVGDDSIGLTEAIYVLQKTAGLR